MSDKDDEKRDPEELQKELQEFLRNRLGASGVSVFMPMGGETRPQSPPQESDEEKEERTRKRAEALRFELRPAEVKAHLDRFVIGQEEAKKILSVAVCDHYNHVRRVHTARDRARAGRAVEQTDYVKQNIILLGPTGVGKTYLLRTVAQLLGVPFVKADITKFSETGYVGGDVDDLVRELVRMADGDIELAEYGIVFLDEIDKIASSANIMGRDVSGRGVQTGLLKLLEETEVSARSPGDLTAQIQDIFGGVGGGGGKRGKQTINTRHVLFVVSGAFSGLEELIEKRLSQQSVGFKVTDESAGPDSERNLLSEVTTKDFIDYGFEPEFIGRLPIRVALDPLDEDDLFNILEKSEGSILRQYGESFLGYGIEAGFADDALRAVAARAMQEGTGARGLMTVLDRALRDFKFHLPGSPVKRFLVTRDVVERPTEVLDGVVADPRAAAAAFARFEVRQFEKDFESRYGVGLDFDDSAIDMAIAVSSELGLGLAEYLEKTFEKHTDFLVKIREKSGRKRLPVTPQILNRPGDALDLWL